MELSSADFMKLSVNDVSDLLLNDLTENNKTSSGAVLRGVSDDGRMYSLYVKLEVFVDE